MNRNILIVESENDKYFVEALLKHINQSNVEVDSPICNIDDYECLEGIGSLEKKIKNIKRRILKDEDIAKIGIILDADSVGVEARVEQINRVLKALFELDSDLDNINKFVKDEESEVEFSCYITNIEGNGELETLLRELADEKSIFADCLESWQECLERNEKTIKQKEFDKFWIQIYQRYDCCSNKERKRAGEKCNNRISFEKNIYNFDKDIKELKSLKSFLRLFN